MAKLILLSGVPGSGKSYFADAFRKAIGGHVYVVSSDALRYEVTGNQQNLDEDKLVWKMFYGMAHVYAMDKNGICILDATNSVCKYRTSIIAPFRKLYEEIHLVAFDLDKDVVRSQNLNRLFPIKPEILEELFEKYEYPNEQDDEFFDSVTMIKDHNIEEVIDKLRNK
ncbi:MAG: ATP-binding protein [Bacilli bacterium]|nr:ATP-binding protein [Bacilli bacterium]